jgi:hypothetical protein
MKKHGTFVAAAALCLLIGALPAAAQDPKGAGQDTSASSSSSSSSPSSSSSSSESTHWYSPSRYKRYNPVKLFKRNSKPASEYLADNPEEQKKLTVQLQTHGLLPQGATLGESCSNFKSVEDCLAAIHASHNAGVKFQCLKWHLTAIEPGDAGPCPALVGGNAESLAKAIGVLKPDADAAAEAKKAQRQARDDISDARS